MREREDSNSNSKTLFSKGGRERERGVERGREREGETERREGERGGEREGGRVRERVERGREREGEREIVGWGGEREREN